MDAVMALTAVVSAVCFVLHYGNIASGGAVLWTGIVAFMILYHFWLRILFGILNKRLPLRRDHPWFRPRAFEAPLYRFLHVKRWKDKALTYDPDAFDLQKHSLEEVADTMVKSEFDHWTNEVISLLSILFALLWGHAWIFVLTAVLAMIFDAQFIVIQRYNRPNVLRILSKQRARQLACVSS